MGTKLLLGFGGTVIQVVVHPQSKYQQLWHQFRRHRKSSSSSPLQVTRPSGPVFRKYGKPSSSSPLQISAGRSIRFGGTANQAVVHHLKNGSNLTISFGGTVIQAVVHPVTTQCRQWAVSEVP